MSDRTAIRKLIKEILAPLIVALAEQAHQMPAGMQAQGTRGARQPHPGFFRSPASFAIIARMAAGDQILPGGFASPGARLHVVERQLSGIESSQAILAGITI